MQPSKRATSAIIMVLVIHVMLVVSVVLPLLWFMLGPWVMIKCTVGGVVM